MSAKAPVLVIGAGPAGISTAYYLERAAIPYRIVEKTNTLASTWANLYSALRLNTAGFVSHLPGKRIPLRYGIYPTGRQYYDYVQRYMRDHAFPIDFNVTVQSVTPVPDGWRVVTDRDDHVYPCVVIASGRFSKPYVPPIPGIDQFAGETLHASAYHAADTFAGKRVLVVGNGPSGADIAVDLQHHAMRPVLLAIRSDIVISREYPNGLPPTVWHLIANRLPKQWRKSFLNRVNFQSYPGIETLGLPLAPNRDERAGSSAPVRGKHLIAGLRAGTIQVVAGLASLTCDEAILLDGSRVEVDSVILCTGYRPAIDYLDFPFSADRDGWITRRADDSQQISDRPGLFLVGRFYRGLGPLYNIRQEARIAVQEIAIHLQHSRIQGQPHETAHAHDLDR